MQEKENWITRRYELLAAQVVKNLESRHFEAYYCKNREEAAAKALSLIPEGSLVSWGGSVTLQETGLIDKVYKAGFRVIDRDKAKSPEEKSELGRQALLCDCFLAGINAIAEEGVLVNIDGLGNRVAATIYGPKSVILTAGMNKVCKTLEDARSRARNCAAPFNARRVGTKNTPCAVSGSCGNCKSPESICTFTVETRLCRPEKRIKVILIGEDLGF
ncbi:MAG: lactate utilization protein [Treponema sp.]|jgi:L-lactate utilization protein LutB|nr:lactate utilization protein [Treponema sp.]